MVAGNVGVFSSFTTKGFFTRKREKSPKNRNCVASGNIFLKKNKHYTFTTTTISFTKPTHYISPQQTYNPNQQTTTHNYFTRKKAIFQQKKYIYHCKTSFSASVILNSMYYYFDMTTPNTFPFCYCPFYFPNNLRKLLYSTNQHHSTSHQIPAKPYHHR